MTVTTTSPMDLPDFPLTCLKTAEAKNTSTAFRGKNTVIDFWTTKCTNCPEALDKLDAMKQESKYSNVEFVSICCDKLDGAREILEKDDQLRWNNISHYFMEEDDKEKAKKILGFKSVPFYVVVNETGEIVQKGNSKQIDFKTIPGIVRPTEDKENELQHTKQISNAPAAPLQQQPVQVERVFCIEDDFDF